MGSSVRASLPYLVRGVRVGHRLSHLTHKCTYGPSNVAIIGRWPLYEVMGQSTIVAHDSALYREVAVL